MQESPYYRLELIDPRRIDWWEVTGAVSFFLIILGTCLV